MPRTSLIPEEQQCHRKPIVQTNSELIRAILARNDQQAFSRLVLRYERLVWASVWHVLRDYHTTQDVTQETFLKAHEHLKELREPDAVGIWLCRIARREARRTKRGGPKTLGMDDVDLPVPAPTVLIRDEYQTLIEAVGRLPEHERVVVVLRYLNNHTVAEVAHLTGRPVSTVTKQLSRAIKRLQQFLSHQRSNETISHCEKE